MTPIIDPEFEALIPPLAPEQLSELRASIARDGVREPVALWDGLVVDGHNRAAIAAELGIPCPTVQVHFADRAEAMRWMIANQCARRNWTNDQYAATCALAGAPVAPEHPAYVSYCRLLDVIQVANRRELVARVKSDALYSYRMALNDAFPRAPRAPRVHPQTSPAPTQSEHDRASYVASANRPGHVPQGPSAAPRIPAGHELAGQSTLTGPDGEVRGSWDKTRIASAGAVVEPIPAEHHVTKRSTHFGADGSVRGQHVTVKADEVARERAMLEAWARHAQLYEGLADATPAPAGTDAELLTVYPLGDPHIGLLAWAPETGDHHDLEIGTRELVATVRGLVARAPASKVGMIVNLGDFLHAQDDSNKTPGHGNMLDVDGRHAKVLDAGHACLRAIVDAALAKHEEVIVLNLPGNHDPRVSAELAMWLRAVYEREPRVQIRDAFRAHQYERHGCVLLGFHHGDRSKPGELPAIMATDRAADWGETTERVWHCGHVHHLTRHETPGCVVETHRTMAGADAWHAGKYRAGRSLQAITYHATFGEESRDTVSLARVRAAMKGSK